MRHFCWLQTGGYIHSNRKGGHMSTHAGRFTDAVVATFSSSFLITSIFSGPTGNKVRGWSYYECEDRGEPMKQSPENIILYPVPISWS